MEGNVDPNKWSFVVDELLGVMNLSATEWLLKLLQLRSIYFDLFSIKYELVSQRIILLKIEHETVNLDPFNEIGIF